MNKLFRIFATATLGLGLLSTVAFAGAVSPSQQEAPASGMIIVPTSASPTEDVAPAAAFRRGKIVAFETAAQDGDIIVDTKANRLYFVLGNGRAAMYRVATAKRGFGEEVWCGGLAAGRAMRGEVAESTGGNTQKFAA